MADHNEDPAIVARIKANRLGLPARKAHRLPTDSYAVADSVFFFTLCARHHGAPFTSPTLAKAIIESLLWRKQKHGWTLFCYCLMPDHLHFLLKLPDAKVRLYSAGGRGVVPETVLDQIRDFKKYTTSQIWQKQGGEGSLWQRGSYDEGIGYNKPIEQAALYVLNNPIRKGMVERWEDYPYSGIVDPW